MTREELYALPQVGDDVALYHGEQDGPVFDPYTGQTWFVGHLKGVRVRRLVSDQFGAVLNPSGAMQ